MRPQTCPPLPASATPADYASDDRCASDARRKSAETSTRVRLIRARRSLGWKHDVTALELGVSRHAVQLWETGRRRIPAWALVLVEEFAAAAAVTSPGSSSHAAPSAPLVAGTARAKHLSIRPNENGAPAVVSASAQPGNLTGDRSNGLSVDSQDATGSSPAIATDEEAA